MTMRYMHIGINDQAKAIAHLPANPRCKCVGSYARYSSELQDSRSITDQQR